MGVGAGRLTAPPARHSSVAARRVRPYFDAIEFHSSDACRFALLASPLCTVAACVSEVVRAFPCLHTFLPSLACPAQAA